jgi:cell division protein FtsW (lipid II flippase)
MPWPKLLGGILGLESLGLILWQLQWWWWRVYVTHGQVTGIEIFWLAVAVVISVLAYCIYRAHGWARWAVIALGICSVAFILVATTISAAQNWTRLSEWTQPMTGEVRAQQILQVAQSYGLALCFIAAVALVVLLLFRPDVAATFSRPHDQTI